MNIETLIDRLKRITNQEIPADPADDHETANALRRWSEHPELVPLRKRLADRALLIEVGHDREACAQEVLDLFAQPARTVRERIRKML